MKPDIREALVILTQLAEDKPKQVECVPFAHLMSEWTMGV